MHVQVALHKMYLSPLSSDSHSSYLFTICGCVLFFTVFEWDIVLHPVTVSGGPVQPAHWPRDRLPQPAGPAADNTTALWGDSQWGGDMVVYLYMHMHAHVWGHLRFRKAVVAVVADNDFGLCEASDDSDFATSDSKPCASLDKSTSVKVLICSMFLTLPDSIWIVLMLQSSLICYSKVKTRAICKCAKNSLKQDYRTLRFFYESWTLETLLWHW